MPIQRHNIHAFDLRSVVLFTCLTLGGTTAVLAQAADPRTSTGTVAPATPAAPAPAPAAITPSEAFMRSDLNRDGQLSPEEAQNLPAVAEQFSEWDRDGNGQLSLEEFLLGAKAPK